MTEERLSFVPPNDLIERLPTASMAVSGFYDERTTMPFYPEMADRPIRVMVMVPRSRWQAFKAIHGEAWWLSWFVSRWPVRTKATHRFTGRIVSFDDGEATISADGPVERA